MAEAQIRLERKLAGWATALSLATYQWPMRCGRLVISSSTAQTEIVAIPVWSGVAEKDCAVARCPSPSLQTLWQCCPVASAGRHGGGLGRYVAHDVGVGVRLGS